MKYRQEVHQAHCTEHKHHAVIQTVPRLRSKALLRFANLQPTPANAAISLCPWCWPGSPPGTPYRAYTHSVTQTAPRITSTNWLRFAQLQPTPANASISLCPWCRTGSPPGAPYRACASCCHTNCVQGTFQSLVKICKFTAYTGKCGDILAPMMFARKCTRHPLPSIYIIRSRKLRPDLLPQTGEDLHICSLHRQMRRYPCAHGAGQEVHQAHHTEHIHHAVIQTVPRVRSKAWLRFANLQPTPANAIAL